MIQFTLETDKALFEKAMRFSQKQVKRLIDTHPDFYPMYTQEGKWKHDGPTWTRWCDGFLPGMMWLFRRFEAETGGKDPEYWYQEGHRLHEAAGEAEERPRCARPRLRLPALLLPLVSGRPGSEAGRDRD